MTQESDPAIQVHNPLPLALHHYEQAVVDVLTEATGQKIGRTSAVSAEVSGSSVFKKLTRASKELAARTKISSIANRTIVCWPVYGLMDPVLWIPVHKNSVLTLVIHDPIPLRRQVGMGRLSAFLGRLAASRQKFEIVVHSEPAKAALSRMKWRSVSSIPHPVRQFEGSERKISSDRYRILVCGQHKEARDLKLLEALGPLLRQRGYETVIKGRGWPDILGWEVEDTFLDEQDLSSAIADSAAVLVPYRSYFQSGIAIRALENGVPVVGLTHPFLQDLFGNDWHGLVASDSCTDWIAAIERCCIGGARLEALHSVYRERTVAKWKQHFLDRRIHSS